MILGVWRKALAWLRATPRQAMSPLLRQFADLTDTERKRVQMMPAMRMQTRKRSMSPYVRDRRPEPRREVEDRPPRFKQQCRVCTHRHTSHLEGAGLQSSGTKALEGVRSSLARRQDNNLWLSMQRAKVVVVDSVCAALAWHAKGLLFGRRSGCWHVASYCMAWLNAVCLSRDVAFQKHG